MTAHALVLAMAIVVASTQRDTVRSKRNTEAAQPQHRGSDSLPVMVRLLNTGESEEQAKGDSASKARESRLTESLIDWTKVLGVATIFLAVFTLGLWWVTRGTLKHLRTEFFAEHRPWIAIQKIGAVEDITWTEQDAHVPIHFTLKNTGRTPAIEAWPAGVIFPFFFTGTEEVAADHKRFWEEVDNRTVKFDVIGPTIAPGQKIEQRNTLRISTDDAKAYRAWYAARNGNCKLMMVGAVTYRSRLDTKEHRTGMVWEMWNRDMEHTAPIDSGSTQGTRLSRSVFGPGLTD